MIPDYQSLMRPVLACAAAGETRIGDSVEMLADQLGHVFIISGNEDIHIFFGKTTAQGRHDIIRLASVRALRQLWGSGLRAHGAR